MEQLENANEKSEKRTRLALLVVLYGTMFVFGFLENIKGVSFPLIKNEFGVSGETQGRMLALTSWCYTAFVITAGFVLGRAGVKAVYMMGFAGALAGAASIFFMPGYWSSAASLMLIFAGFGMFEIAVNGTATRIFVKKTALMMSLLHFMYGLGSMAGPKAAGILASPEGFALGWRAIYLFSVPLILAVLVPAALTKFPRIHGEGAAAAADGAPAGKGYIAALKTPAVWVFGLILGLSMAIEMMPPNWGGLYFQDAHGLDPATAGANFVAAYFMVFTLSRLVSGFAIEKIGYMKSMALAVLVILAVFAGGFALGARGIYVLPALGFFTAVLWPTLMAVAMRHFGEDAPVMASAIIAIAGFSNGGVQFLVGYILHLAGPQWGFRSGVAFAVVLLGLLFALHRGFLRKGAKAA